MNQPMPGNCRSCNAPVSREAKTCPHCGQPDPFAEWVAEAQRELAQGRLSEAIQVVRDATGMGKTEAKYLVESWKR